MDNHKIKFGNQTSRRKKYLYVNPVVSVIYNCKFLALLIEYICMYGCIRVFTFV